LISNVKIRLLCFNRNWYWRKL